MPFQIEGSRRRTCELQLAWAIEAHARFFEQRGRDVHSQEVGAPGGVVNAKFLAVLRCLSSVLDQLSAWRSWRLSG